jgi:parallel beta-helix repeat protein
MWFMLRFNQVLTLAFILIISNSIIISKAETIDQNIVVNETIFISNNFNGAGKTYIHGPNLGDLPLFRLIGSGATLSNLTVDDNHFLGVWSAVDIGGTDNTVEYVTLKNSSRYGLTFGGALRGTYRHITIEECQHGISGSSGQLSDWNPSVDCLIEDCYIQGMSVCGIKLKNFLRLTIRNNQIDINSDPSSNKSGIYFAGSDTASKFCLVENNNVFSSTPHRGYGINIHQDTDPDIVFSEGNVVRNNKITGTNIGIRLTGSHFNIYNNEMINVKTEYEVKTLVYGSPTFQPPSDNIVIEYNSSIDTTIPQADLPVVVVDGSTKSTDLALKDTNIGGTYETTSIILSTPAINSGLSETVNIMVQIIPIFGIIMVVGASSGKINIKVLLGFLVAIVFVVLFSNIMI